MRATTKEIPKDESDLRRQIRRAAISIPANIAEGYRRKGKRPAHKNHISIAMGSQGELETEIAIAMRNSFIGRERGRSVLDLNHRVGAMLYRLLESLD